MISYIWFISLIVFGVSADDTFNYNKNVVSYVVGQKITDNAPKNMPTGKYSVKPALAKGLSLDTDTGIISGTPTEEFKGECVVTFIESGASSKKTSVISISVWDKPTSLKCTVTKLRAVYKINNKFECKADRSVSSYSIVNPLPGVSINNEGLLTFTDYTTKGEQEIVIKAQNEAGDTSYTLSVYIKEETIYLNGVYVTLKCLNDFDCGEDPTGITVNFYGSDAIDEIKDLIDESRNTNMNTLIQNALLPYCDQFQYEYDGFINVTEAEEFTFYYKPEGKGTLYIDDTKVLDLMDKCYTWNADLDVYNSNSIQLSVGIHRFYLKGYSPSHDYGDNIDYMSFRMWMKYSTTSDPTKRTIPLYYVDQKFDPIYDLVVDTTVHYIPLGLDASIQFITPYIMSSYQCNTTTPLPQGLSINSQNQIEGRVVKAQSLTEYDLYCHNEYSETNHVKISIAITDRFNKGVVGYYMKASYGLSCYTELDPSYSEVNTAFIRIDKSLTHEYNENNTAWEGLTQNFVMKYGVRWEGYLQVEETITSVKLSSVDSSFLYLGNLKNTLIYHACHNDYTPYDISVAYTKGLYGFALVYTKGTESKGSGIKLEVKLSGSDEYVDASDYLVYVPNGDFEYTYHTATYTTDGDIQSNTPIISNTDKVVKGYTVTPDLPDGLVLNPTTGTITGNPSTMQDKKEYTVTVEFDDNSKTTTLIYIKIDGDSTPKGLHIVNYKTGEEATNPIVVYLGEESNLLAAQLNGYVDSIKYTKYPSQFMLRNDNLIVSNDLLNEPFENYTGIIPVQCLGRDVKYTTKSKLPDGLSLIESNGELKGIVTSPISSEFKINIICSNVNGSISGDSTIKIEESSYPILVNYEKVVTIIGGVDYVNYKFCNVSGSSNSYSLTTSFPDYLKFDKNSGTISGYVLKSYGDSVYTMIISGGGKSIHFDFTLSFVIEDKPIVVEHTVVKEKKFTGGSEINGFKLFEVVGTNIAITVTPPLPSGIYLNKNSAMIYGIASEIKPAQNYVFTVKNPPSPEEIKVTIHLEFETVHCSADSGFPDTIAIPGGKTVIIKCSGGKSGYMSRSCYLTDAKPIWSGVRDDCTSDAGTIAAIVVGVIAALIVVGCIVLFCVLRSGIFRKRATSSVGRSSRTRSMVENMNEKVVKI